MTTERKFAGFNKDGSVSHGYGSSEEYPPFRMKEIPDGGLCLSTFLVLSKQGMNDTVLMGHLNPKASWDHIGALDESRIRAHGKGWILPSSHLIIHESPHEAAERILREQLEIRNRDAVKLSDPKVVSEVYTPARFPELVKHWDIEFIFRGIFSSSETPKSEAWTDLEFLSVSELTRSQIARSHEDILESSGFRIPS